MGKRNAKHQDNYAISVNWRYTSETTPAFRRLLAILLRPRNTEVDSADSQ